MHFKQRLVWQMCCIAQYGYQMAPALCCTSSCAQPGRCRDSVMVCCCLLKISVLATSRICNSSALLLLQLQSRLALAVSHQQPWCIASCACGPLCPAHSSLWKHL